ncbi:flagellar basal body P-ring formation protein FlgA [Rhodobacterales bacterium HKCCE2091]|nr:flagellar basal body P-ring formation protein FlgA [Rhodobacterales bacterium HKCCE2091]
MIRFLVFLILLGPFAPARADIVVATGTIRSQQVIGPADIALADGNVPGALTRIDDAIGLEARINIYPGRPVRAGDLQEPALVERNEIVTLRYSAGGLVIMTEGRSLDRAGIGELIRVQNLASRTAVTGRVLGPGLVSVGNMQ